MHPLAIAGIGCGGLLLITVIAGTIFTYKVAGVAKEKYGEFTKDPTLAIAGLIVQTNPDLEMVSSDSDAGTLTVKVKSSGEQIVLDRAQIEQGKFSFTKVKADGTEEVVDIDFSDAANGRVSVTDGAGETLLETSPDAADKIPGWVPPYPGAGVAEGTFKVNIGNKQSGSFRIKTEDTPQDVVDRYRPALEAAGFTVNSQGLETNGTLAQSILTATDATTGHSINLVIIPTNEGSTIQATYTNQK